MAKVDLTTITDKERCDEVAKMVENYRATKSKSTDLKMSIVLTIEQLVYQCPRRIPKAEKKIASDQVKQWLQKGGDGIRNVRNLRT